MDKKSKYLGLILLAITSCVSAINQLHYFKLDSYKQDVNFWINSGLSNYSTNLMSKSNQDSYFVRLKATYFAIDDTALSPWSKSYFDQHKLSQNVPLYVANQFKEFDNSLRAESDQGYGINLINYGSKWLNQMRNNVDFGGLLNLKYQSHNRAIVTTNTNLKLLPTNDPFYIRYNAPGYGYPFDMLQQSSLYVGDPVYIMSYTLDKRYALVASLSNMGWVNANDIGLASPLFITKWQNMANRQIGVVTKVDTPILSRKNGNFLFDAYVGMMFPLIKEKDRISVIMVPVRDKDGMAEIVSAVVTNNGVSLAPLAITPQKIGIILQQLEGRPYSWGGVGFYNDCSAEMRQLFSVFGIWLPRDSFQQAQVGASTVDLQKLTPKDRYDYVMKHAKPFLSLIYINGHIMLYIGNYIVDGQLAPVVYQNMWGMRPRDVDDRELVGKSIFLPLILTYPDAPEVKSHLEAKQFQIVNF